MGFLSGASIRRTGALKRGRTFDMAIQLQGLQRDTLALMRLDHSKEACREDAS
jgi:hypothetical protein